MPAIAIRVPATAILLWSKLSVTRVSAHAPADGSNATHQWLIDWRVRVNGSRQYRAPSQPSWHGVIPAHIFQLSNLPDEELAANGMQMRKWWELNPDWHYHLFSERDCIEFVHRFGYDEERAVYASLKLGAQRADVCRVHLLRRIGGVYADADVEPRQPLHSMLPANASAVRIPLPDGAAWPFAFLAFAAAHPIMQTHAENVGRAIREQIQRLRSHIGGCNGVRSCVLAVTGPFAFDSSVNRTFWRLGCTHENLKHMHMAWPCRSSRDEQMRGTFLAASRASDAAPLVHHSCSRASVALSPGHRPCAPGHYSFVRSAADVFCPATRAKCAARF